jgi:hypothetical protein
VEAVKTIKPKKNEECHDLLEILTEDKIFGEVTFYMQGGKVESVRVSERHNKSELIAKMEARKRKKVLVIQKGAVNA